MRSHYAKLSKLSNDSFATRLSYDTFDTLKVLNDNYGPFEVSESVETCIVHAHFCFDTLKLLFDTLKLSFSSFDTFKLSFDTLKVSKVSCDSRAPNCPFDSFDSFAIM